MVSEGVGERKTGKKRVMPLEKKTEGLIVLMCKQCHHDVERLG